MRKWVALDFGNSLKLHAARAGDTMVACGRYRAHDACKVHEVWPSSEMCLACERVMDESHAPVIRTTATLESVMNSDVVAELRALLETQSPPELLKAMRDLLTERGRKMLRSQDGRRDVAEDYLLLAAKLDDLASLYFHLK